eukprot:3663282-Amphidinium_carterae.1
MHAFDRFRANGTNTTPALHAQGSFRNGMHELHAFDKNAEVTQSTTNKYFWIVDNASHRYDFTRWTFKHFRAHLDRGGVYIIEGFHTSEDKSLRRAVGRNFDMWQCNQDQNFYVITHVSAYPTASGTP